MSQEFRNEILLINEINDIYDINDIDNIINTLTNLFANMNIN